MDHYSEMRVFVAVAQAQSLAATARRLDLSAPTVTRAIVGLEQRIGAALLERSTRGVQLTEVGERYFADCTRILALIDEAEHSAAGAHASAVGNLVVSSPIFFGEKHLMPVVLAFLEAHPAVSLNARFMDRLPNLHEEGIDVAVLTGALPDLSLVALRVGSIRRVLVASPSYLKRRGTPTHPEQLAQHQLVASVADSRTGLWRFQEDGAELGVRIAPRWHTSTNASAIAAALSGAGITRVMSYQVGEDLAAKRLKVVLEPWELPPIPVHVVYQEGRRAAARVRSFVDHAVKALRATLA